MTLTSHAEEDEDWVPASEQVHWGEVWKGCFAHQSRDEGGTSPQITPILSKSAELSWSELQQLVNSSLGPKAVLVQHPIPYRPQELQRHNPETLKPAIC